jgi:hypothetical protein
MNKLVNKVTLISLVLLLITSCGSNSTPENQGAATETLPQNCERVISHWWPLPENRLRDFDVHFWSSNYNDNERFESREFSANSMILAAIVARQTNDALGQVTFSDEYLELLDSIRVEILSIPLDSTRYPERLLSYIQAFRTKFCSGLGDDQNTEEAKQVDLTESYLPLLQIEDPNWFLEPFKIVGTAKDAGVIAVYLYGGNYTCGLWVFENRDGFTYIKEKGRFPGTVAGEADTYLGDYMALSAGDPLSGEYCWDVAYSAIG